MDVNSVRQTCEYFNIALCMPWIWVLLKFLYIWGCSCSNEISLLKQLSPYQLYTQGVACWEVIWPNDLQTRLYQYTGIPIDRLHWNHTDWCYHPVVFRWQSSVNLHHWNTLEGHWKHTGNTLADNNSYSSGIPVHWGLNSRHTGLPLDCHWITTGSG